MKDIAHISVEQRVASYSMEQVNLLKKQKNQLNNLKKAKLKEKTNYRLYHYNTLFFSNKEATL